MPHRKRSGPRGSLGALVARAGAASAVAVAACVCSTSAFAGDTETADRLFQEALTLSDAGDWDAACPKFKQSFDADPSVGALLNMAYCSERAGDLLLAKRQYGDAGARNESTADAIRRDAVKQQVTEATAALDQRIPTLVVVAQPARARVSIDGAPTTAGGDALAIGRHFVRVEADGFMTQERSIELAERQRLRLEIELVPSAPRPIARNTAHESGPGLLIPGLVTGGVGLAVAGAGAGLLAAAFLKADEIAELCGDAPEPPACFGTKAQAAEATELSKAGRPLEIAGAAMASAGAAALVTGVIMLAAGGAPSDEGTASFGFTPSVGPDSLGGVFTARF